jgi:hypothetical protein
MACSIDDFILRQVQRATARSKVGPQLLAIAAWRRHSRTSHHRGF